MGLKGPISRLIFNRPLNEIKAQVSGVRKAEEYLKGVEEQWKNPILTSSYSLPNLNDNIG